MSNATMTKFGYPKTLVAETDEWAVLARPQQLTLGSLVLVHRSDASAFGQLEPAAFTALQAAVASVERMLQGFVSYDKINYLMLMMVDPHVHFHVIPRYDGRRIFEGVEFPDAGWPGPPALGSAISPGDALLSNIVTRLRELWGANT